jgi:signal peptidase II
VTQDAPIVRPAWRSPLAWVLFLSTAAILLGVDLWTKKLAVDKLCVSMTQLEGGKYAIESREVQAIPGFLHFTFLVNQGAVFGLGQGWQWLFMVVSGGAVLVLIGIFARSGDSRLLQFLAGMLLAGVIGNLYDRATYNYVRDMIHIFPRWEVFPWIFNVADSLLCVGVFLMIVLSFVADRKAAKAKAQLA